MEKLTVDLPGFEGADANFIAAILNEVHDIAQELAYIKEANLSGLDKNNRYFVEAAFSYAVERAHAELSDIMLEIRNMRTPIDPCDEKSYRALASKYARTSATKV